MLPAIVLAVALATRPACSSGCPPENVVVKVIEPTGPALWIDFIGRGPAGDSPVIDSVRQMTADGFFLRSDGTCGWRANPCVVVGP